MLYDFEKKIKVICKLTCWKWTDFPEKQSDWKIANYKNQKKNNKNYEITSVFSQKGTSTLDVSQGISQLLLPI